MPFLTWVLCAVLIGYAFGAIPFAWLIARRYGVNILKVGSGNPGATNVRRTVGKGPGNAVFVLDFLKGLAAAGWPGFVVDDEHTVVYAAIGGLAGAVAGHSYSVFLRFRGGKGVATTMGGLVAIFPQALLAGIGVWVIVYYVSRYVSLASLLFALSLPAAVAFLAPEPRTPLLVFSVVIALLIFYRHRSNIKQLLDGSEHRFDREASEGALERDQDKNGKG